MTRPQTTAVVCSMMVFFFLTGLATAAIPRLLGCSRGKYGCCPDGVTRRSFIGCSGVDLCTKPMDIAFLVDKSGSFGRKNLGLAKTIMEKTVDYFGMSDQGNHYAIIEFGKNPTTIVNFNTFTGDEVRSANLKLKIKQMNRIDWGGGSYIDRALLAANSTLFTVGSGMRQNAIKAAFVMSDGGQTKNRGPFVPLNTAAEGLRKKGVQLIAVGIGKNADINELAAIATPQNVFHGDQLSSDPKKFNKIAFALCSSKDARVPDNSYPAGVLD